MRLRLLPSWLPESLRRPPLDLLTLVAAEDFLDIDGLADELVGAVTKWCLDLCSDAGEFSEDFKLRIGVDPAEPWLKEIPVVVIGRRSRVVLKDGRTAGKGRAAIGGVEFGGSEDACVAGVAGTEGSCVSL